MPARKRPENQPEPDPEKKPKKSAAGHPRDPSALRQPASPIDAAISTVLDDLRKLKLPDTNRVTLARMAGQSDHHALRLFRTPRGADRPLPRQAWTLADLVGYCRALDVTVASVLVAAGVEAPARDLAEVILTEPTLDPAARGTMLTMLQALRSR